MFSIFAESHPLYIVLAAWFLVWGLAAVDLYDLSDDLMPPPVVLDQLVASELEEPDGPAVAFVSEAAVFQTDRSAILCRGGRIARDELRAQRSGAPLYRQFAQYRI